MTFPRRVTLADEDIYGRSLFKGGFASAFESLTLSVDDVIKREFTSVILYSLYQIRLLMHVMNNNFTLTC